MGALLYVCLCGALENRGLRAALWALSIQVWNPEYPVALQSIPSQGR
jgi:hypothetical protein